VSVHNKGLRFSRGQPQPTTEVSRSLYSRFVWFFVLSLFLGSDLIFRPVAAVGSGSVPDVPATHLAAAGGRAAPDVALSIPTSALDEETLSFTIRILAGNPIGYQCSFETKGGGKDHAQLNIENAASPATP